MLDARHPRISHGTANDLTSDVEVSENPYGRRCDTDEATRDNVKNKDT